MSEIKFRAWHKFYRHMYYNVQATYDYLCMSPATENIPATYFQDLIDSGDFEVMQYAKLKDSEGNDIYEGDLVEVKSFGNPIAQVRYVEKDGCWALFHESFVRSVIQYKRLTAKTIKDCDMKVVGNIYENPQINF